MSLEFLRKKRFQLRHRDVFCQRLALTNPCVSSLCVTFHQVLQCSTSLARPGERISEPSSCLPVVNGPNICVDAARLPDLLRAHEDVERFLLPQGSSALCTIGPPAFAKCPKTSQLPLPRSLLSLLAILFPRPTSRRFSFKGVCSRRSSLCVVLKIRTHSLCSSTVRLDETLLLTFLQCFDATENLESSTQPAVQRVDPFSRGPAATFLTQASELSHVAAQPVFPTPIDQCLMNVCAVSVHNVFTTTNELKGKVTTRIRRDYQPQVVTVCACR